MCCHSAYIFVLFETVSTFADERLSKKLRYILWYIRIIERKRDLCLINEHYCEYSEFRFPLQEPQCVYIRSVFTNIGFSILDCLLTSASLVSDIWFNFQTASERFNVKCR